MYMYHDNDLFLVLSSSQSLWELTREATSLPPIETVERWAARLSEVLGITIRCTQCVYKMLTARASFLRAKSRQIRGGVQRKKFFGHNWTLKLPAKHVSTPAQVAKENVQLRAQVRSLTSSLITTADELRRMQQGIETRGKRNAPGDYTDRHQRRLKKQRVDSCRASLSWLQQEGLTPLSVDVLNSKTSRKQTIKLGSIEEALHTEGGSIEQPELDMVTMMLYIKDRYSVSGSAYHEMAKVCADMPRHYQVKKKIAELNQRWDIHPTPNGTIGVQQRLEGRLRERVRQLVKNSPSSASFKATKKLRVKLSGDGTKIGKRLHVINFTYVLLDEGDKAYSYEGNHSLAIFREPENYEALQRALEDVIREVDHLETIEVDGTEYAIEYFLGGDWKFLAIVTGTYVLSHYVCTYLHMHTFVKGPSIGHC